MDSTVATKNFFFKSVLMLEVHTRSMPLRAFHAKAFLTAVSCSELSTHDPRYLKSPFHSSSVPPRVFRGGEVFNVLGEGFGFRAIETKAYFTALTLDFIEQHSSLVDSV